MLSMIDGRLCRLRMYTRAFRSLLLAPVSALFIPSVETIGVAATNSVSGILALIGYLYESLGRI